MTCRQSPVNGSTPKISHIEIIYFIEILKYIRQTFKNSDAVQRLHLKVQIALKEEKSLYICV